ncbi:SUPPRESSOR OF GAMMA RESPONSE 1 [Brachypodium distachyon]|uniref:NAC domain-containing protein n=1 Tax=Brachypodium distachyon TaxID=15368 RepID=I1IYV3_BRADI|nr:SUPPRESSOR OF GAMMA RESPONSE 1 [Brachypodium distachyon]KQJ83161.1 hypothetical protein BRADI_5g13450v3 [Brachypodium distachyon]|eukprot:XP_003581357.2 SUPPRESSOR OF GAMMA RESPONSE 1 [Brachypodium distachyon]
MEESLIITWKTIAKIIRKSTNMSPFEIEKLVAEAWRECPNCKCRIDNDVSSQWPGLPAGVKFDPSDLELLTHLEAKVGLGNSASHILIDDFIPTIEEIEGICYTHPENLPGIKIDGTNSYFFHTISNAYDVGQRKRRKVVSSDHTVRDEPIRWHKTGKSRSISENGVVKGWKKILVLYIGSKKKGADIYKTNWTMHQYHLGVEEDEKHGELVVSKIFWQLRSNKTRKSQIYVVDEEYDSVAGEIDPTTPMTNPPQPRRLNSSPSKTEQNEEEDEEYGLTSQAINDAATLPGLAEHPLSNGTHTCPKNAPLPLDMDALHGFSHFDKDLFDLPDNPFGSQDSLSWLDLDDKHIEEKEF